MIRILLISSNMETCSRFENPLKWKRSQKSWFQFDAQLSVQFFGPDVHEAQSTTRHIGFTTCLFVIVCLVLSVCFTRSVTPALIKNTFCFHINSVLQRGMLEVAHAQEILIQCEIRVRVCFEKQV